MGEEVRNKWESVSGGVLHDMYGLTEGCVYQMIDGLPMGKNSIEVVDSEVSERPFDPPPFPLRSA